MSPYQLLKYGLDKETNSLVFIDNVPNGNACGCICPNCKYELVAKNGGLKKEHHFAHTHTHKWRRLSWRPNDCPAHVSARGVHTTKPPPLSLSTPPYGGVFYALPHGSFVFVFYRASSTCGAAWV